MRKLKILLLIILLAIPSKIFAFTANIALTCDRNGMTPGVTAHCTISGTADGSITGFKAVINYPEDLEITSYSPSNIWTNFGDDTLTSGAIMDLVERSSTTTSIITGNFDIASFNVDLAEGSTSTSQQISLSSIVFYYDLVTQYQITNPVTYTFSDFINMSAYQIDNNKKILYGLTPSTIGTFKNSISTNAILKVYNASSVEQTDATALATGQTFSVTFTTGTTNYKLSILGDVLGNGVVSQDDAKKIARHIIDGNVITGDEFIMAADYDGNNIIKMNDAIRLLKSIQN